MGEGIGEGIGVCVSFLCVRLSLSPPTHPPIYPPTHTVTVLRRFVQLYECQQQRHHPAAAVLSPSYSPSSSSTHLPTHLPTHQPAPSSSSTPFPTEAEDAQAHALLSEALRVLLTVFNVCLRPSLLPQNLRLVHYLLYSRRELEPLLAHPAVRGLAAGLEGGLGVVPVALQHFGRLFDETEETLSVEKAMGLLEKGARELVAQWRGEGGWVDGGGGLADPDLKFTYEEEQDAESFFVPYVWEVVYARTKEEIAWVEGRIRVFEVSSGGRGGGGSRSASEAAAVVGGGVPSSQQQQFGGGESKGMATAAMPNVAVVMHV